jgi:type I restriction enzyme M protein
MILNIPINLPIIEKTGEVDILTQNQIVEKIIFIEEMKQKIKEYKKKIKKIIVELDLNKYKYLDIPLVNKKYFNLQRGKRITKTIINSNKGEVPVYSSSKKENSVLGRISEKYLVSNDLILYTRPSILFNLDGSVGFCFLKKDNKYSFIDVVASIFPKTNDIDLEFLLYNLREEILKTGADYKSKFYFNKIKDYKISIKIPITNKGNFDLIAQKEISEKYRKIEEIKSAIATELDKITEINIEI